MACVLPVTKARKIIKNAPLVIALVAFLSILSACASKYDKYEKQKAPFIGKPLNAFIVYRGVPDSQIDLKPSGKMYEWHRDYGRSGFQSVVTSVSKRIGGTGAGTAPESYEPGTSPESEDPKAKRYKRWCDYRVITDDNDIIQDITWEGTYCRDLNIPMR